MTPQHERAITLGVVALATLALSYLSGAPHAVRRLVWAVCCVAAAVILLALSSCSRPPLQSAEVQIASWPVGQARPDPAHCSGFAARVGGVVRVVTAAHCVADHEPGDRVPIVTLERWAYTATGVRWCTVLAADPDADVAVLDPAPEALPEVHALEVAGREPVEGEPVQVVSARGGWEVSRGRVLGPYVERTEAGSRVRWAASTTVDRGWSGSPVLDASGRVLGLVTSCAGVLLPGGGVACRPGFAAFTGVR